MLKEMAEAFNKEGLYTQLLNEGELNILRVKLRQDAPIQLELLFIPKIDHLDVLQFFILLPFKTTDASVIPTARFLSLVNEQLPVGNFNLNEDHHIVYYKHLQPCQKGQIAFQLVWDITGMLNLMVDILSSSLEEVVNGTIPFENAKIDFLEKMGKLLKIPAKA
jgi:hypothetical protein